MGRSMPSTAAASAVPITANCTSCSGEQLTFAPRSSTVTTPPSRVGSCAAIAGRSMPGSVFSTKREIAISAPVLPAEMQACATSSLTRLIATRIDESFFFRSASAGGSCISTTSLAACSDSRTSAGDLSRASTAFSGASRPTAITRASGVSSRNCSAAGSVTAGPWSPPIASTATVTGMWNGLVALDRWGAPPACRERASGQFTRPRARRGSDGPRRGTDRAPAPGLLVGLGLDDLLAAVEAVGADVVAQVRLAGDRLDRQRRAWSGNRARGACRASTATSCSAGQPCVSPIVVRAVRTAPARGHFFAFFAAPVFSPASAANADGAAALRLRPPRTAVPRTLGTLAARRERQRQQQFVLDQRHARPAARRQHDLVLVVLGVERRELALVARQQQQRALRHRPCERPAGTAGTSSGTRRPGHLERRAPQRVGGPGDPPGHVGTPAFGRQPIGRPRQLRDIQRCRRGSPCRSGQVESVERPAGAVPTIRCRPAMPASVPPASADRPARRRARNGPVDQKRWIIARSPTPVKKCPQKQHSSRCPPPLRRRPRRRLVLASTSRYRRAAARAPGHPFIAAAPGTDEAPLPDETPAATALRLAEAKARSVAGAHPDALIIGSDQVADCDGRAIGKPGTHERAVAQLTRAVRPDRRLPHRARAAGRSDGALPDRAGRRAQHLPRPRRRPRSRRTCGASGPTTAPAASSPKRSASRCSRASKATTRPR